MVNSSPVVKHVVVAETDLATLPQHTYRCELCGLEVRTKANLRVHHVKTHRILKVCYSLLRKYAPYFQPYTERFGLGLLHEAKMSDYLRISLPHLVLQA